MQRVAIWSWPALAPWVLTAVQCNAQPPVFEGLGVLSGGENSVAVGASRDLSVVVGWGYLPSGISYAQVPAEWTQGSGFVVAGPVNLMRTIRGVSGSGGVIFGNRVSTYSIASVYDRSSGEFREIGGLPGDRVSTADRSSFDGSVIVGTSTRDFGVLSTRAFRWTLAGGMSSLGVLPGYSTTQPAGVSDDGSVIVGTCRNDAEGTSRAFRWTATEGITPLGVHSPEVQSSATGISGDGRVVVGVMYEQGAVSYQGTAFRWTATSGFSDLARTPGVYISPTALNTDGRVIAGKRLQSSGNGAWIWTEASGPLFLAGYIRALGGDPSGWQLSTVVGVSGDGRTIVGQGRNSSSPLSRNFDDEAWIARLPENLPDCLSVQAPRVTLDCRGYPGTFSVAAIGPEPVRCQPQYRVPGGEWSEVFGEYCTDGTRAMVSTFGDIRAGGGFFARSCQPRTILEIRVRASNDCTVRFSPAITIKICRADMTCDQVVDITDLNRFLDLWFGGNGSADLLRIGPLQPANLIRYLDDWFVGC